jgi:hypothetical protein
MNVYEYVYTRTHALNLKAIRCHVNALIYEIKWNGISYV